MNKSTVLLEHIAGNERIYYATDSLKEAEDAGLPGLLDYNTSRPLPGLPPHHL